MAYCKFCGRELVDGKCDCQEFKDHIEKRHKWERKSADTREINLPWLKGDVGEKEMDFEGVKGEELIDKIDYGGKNEGEGEYFPGPKKDHIFNLEKGEFEGDESEDYSRIQFHESLNTLVAFFENPNHALKKLAYDKEDRVAYFLAILSAALMFLTHLLRQPQVFSVADFDFSFYDRFVMALTSTGFDLAKFFLIYFLTWLLLNLTGGMKLDLRAMDLLRVMCLICMPVSIIYLIAFFLSFANLYLALPLYISSNLAYILFLPSLVTIFSKKWEKRSYIISMLIILILLILATIFLRAFLRETLNDLLNIVNGF